MWSLQQLSRCNSWPGLEQLTRRQHHEAFHLELQRNNSSDYCRKDFLLFENWHEILIVGGSCGSRPSGGINSWSLIRFWSRDAGWQEQSSERTLLPVGLKRWFLFSPVDQPDCSSDPELTSIVRCFCSELSTADWSWRGNELFECNVTLTVGVRRYMLTLAHS